MISAELCVRCKGKLLCGLSYCPILQNYSTQLRITKDFESAFDGASPPSIFVSWHDYPKVTVSPLSTPETADDVSIFDNPERWYGISAERIIEFRSALIMAGKKFHVEDARSPNRELSTMQELTMSLSQTDVDVELEKKPQLILSFCSFFGPLGPKAPLKKIELAANPKVHRKVEYVVSDIDFKAKDALIKLYKDGFSVSFLHKLLSAGLLGIEKNRKIVPTRWSITAVDSNISQHIIDNEIKGFTTIDKYELYHSFYLENDFWVLLLPSVWAFEQLECWLPQGIWTKMAKEHQIIQDHEFYEGRKDYASNVEGAYYAARLAVAEHLAERKRQAACIVFREISDKYVVPLGVWQIRENVRHALKQQPIRFETLDSALQFLSSKLRVPMEEYKKASALIPYFKKQKRITNWF